MKQGLVNVLILVVVVAALAFLLLSGSSQGQARGTIDSAKVKPQGEIYKVEVKLKGNPGSTFVLTYGSLAQAEEARTSLKEGQRVIIDYHGPKTGGDQTVEKIKPWR